MDKQRKLKFPFDLAMQGKKGQGLSLNVIIVAAIALIVLVVLIAIFTGRLGIFQSQLGGEAKAEIQSMQAFYGDCHPNSVAESELNNAYNAADKLTDTTQKAQAKAEAKAAFQSDVNRCKTYSDKANCDNDDHCAWQ